MNCARHLLLRRPPTAALIRPIVFPVAIPLRPASTPIPLILQTIPRLQQVVQTPQKRHNSTAIGSLTNSPAGPNSPGAKKVEEVKPSYYLRFTCRPCGNRSTHNVSKQGYHYGSVLITCPGCFNRHVISDHLKVCSAPLPLSSSSLYPVLRTTNRSSARRPAPSMRSLSSLAPAKPSNDTLLPSAATRSSSALQTPCARVVYGVRAGIT